MSLRKENTQTCHNDRLAVPFPGQQAYPLTAVELSDQDLERVVGGDGPSGLQAFRNGNGPGSPGRPGFPGGAGRPGVPTGPGVPGGPGFPRDWCGCDDPGCFGPDLNGGFPGSWPFWGMI